MKQCPACKTNYNDPAQLFCLSDGAALVDYGDPLSVITQNIRDDESTLVMQPARTGVRVDISGKGPETANFQSIPPPAPSSSGWIKAVVAVFAMGLLLLLVVAVGGIFIQHGNLSLRRFSCPIPGFRTLR